MKLSRSGSTSGRNNYAARGYLELPPLMLRMAVLFFSLFFAIHYPLYMRYSFADLGTAKWEYYRMLLFISIPSILILWIWNLIYDHWKAKKSGSAETAEKKKRSAKEVWAVFVSWWKARTMTDRFVMFFALATLLSFLLSPEMNEVLYEQNGLPLLFWGIEGWNMGLFAQFTFCFLYLVYAYMIP